MAGYNFGSPPKTAMLSMSKFKGVDYQNNPVQVDISRSPLAPNMTINQTGFPQKRKGYECVLTAPGRINGIHDIRTESFNITLVHAGTGLYTWNRTDDTLGTAITTQMNDARSMSFQKDDTLYIVDGLKFRAYRLKEGVWELKDVSEIAFVPTTVISRNPDGTGGTSFQKVNMLSKKRINSFLGKADVKVYMLDVKLLDADAVKARILGSNGEWADMAEGSGFTVDRTLGRITFDAAPGASPVTGMDNVEIEFSKTNADYLSAINRCTFFDIFTIGAGDYLFLSGNDAKRNYDYRSAVSNPTYFPDMNYSVIGQDNTAIVNYVKIGSYQAIVKESNGQDVTIYLRTASTDATGAAAFPIMQGIATSGAVSRYANVNLNEDKLFLTSEGVVALTSTVFTSIMTQNRSFYVNPHLTAQGGLKDAVATVYEGKMYVAVNGNCYVADSRQKGYNKNANTEAFQYEWMHWTNIHARIWYSDNALYFGTDEGKIMRFFAEDGSGAADTYMDDNVIVKAFWDTPYLDFGTIAKYKTLKGMWVMLQPYSRTSCKVYYKTRGRISEVDSPEIRHADIFSFEDLDFTRLTFNTDIAPNVIFYGRKEKKFILIQFRFENDLQEPFGFYKAEMQYQITSKNKG